MQGGMCKFCTYHFPLKFAFLENVGDMLCDYGSLASEQPAHLLLCQPDGFTICLGLKTNVVRCLVNYDSYTNYDTFESAGMLPASLQISTATCNL